MALNHPGLRALLADEIRKNPEFSQRGAAKAMGVAVSTLHEWLKGSTFPSGDETLHKLVQVFYRDDQAPGREEFRQRLYELRDSDSREIDVDDLGRHKLRVTLYERPPFAAYNRQKLEGQRAEGFLDKLLGRFLRLSGIPISDDHIEAGFRSDAVQSLRDGLIDVGVGLYEANDRFGVATLSSPCRIGFNALILEGDPVLDPPDGDSPGSVQALSERVAGIAKALTDGGAMNFRPIVGKFKSDPANTFLKHVVLYDGPRSEADQDPASYAEELIRCSREKLSPVVVCPEWLAIAILTTLATDKRFEGHRGILVFPLSTERAAQKPKIRLPAYSVGLISISRRHKPLIEYARESLTLFLRNETEFVSACLKSVYNDLLTMTTEGLGAMSERGREILRLTQKESCQDPRQWERAIATRCARYMCRLNQGEQRYGLGVLEKAWEPIIGRVLRDIGPIDEDLSDPVDGQFIVGCRAFPPFATPPAPDARGAVKLQCIGDLGWAGQMLQPLRGLIDLPNTRVLKAIPPSITHAANERYHDVRLGLFATPQRAADWEIVRFPVRVPTNVVVRTIDSDMVDGRPPSVGRSLKETLRGGPGLQFEMAYQPQVLRYGSSQEHLSSVLRCPIQAENLIDELNPNVYADRLLEKTSAGTYRFISVDGITCIDILVELANRAAKEGPSKLGQIVYPIVPGEEDRLPSYFLSVSVRRDADKWKHFFQRAWPILLDSNRDWYTDVLAALYVEIQQSSRKGLLSLPSDPMGSGVPMNAAEAEATARRLANWCFGFDESGPEPWGGDLAIWSTVRQRTYAKVVGAMTAARPAGNLQPQ